MNTQKWTSTFVWKIIICFCLIELVWFHLPENAKAASIKHSGKSGDINWTIDSDGVLTVKGEGNFEKSNSGFFVYDKEGTEIFKRDQIYGWEDYSDEIKSAKIKVKGCDDMSGLLYGCKNLKSADFSGSDTSNVKYFDSLLSAYTYVDKDNYIRTISSLEQVNVSCLDTKSAISMSCMFNSCELLKEIDITGWDTSNVTDFTRMFQSCYKLEKIKGIENLDTRNVTSIFAMFEQDYVLKELDLSKWLTNNLKNMEYAFAECKKLSGAFKVLSNDLTYEGAFRYGTSVESDGFTLYYIENLCSKDLIQKIADTMADGFGNPDHISIKTIKEDNGHKWESNYTIVKESTCTSAGLKEIRCSVCGAVKEGSTKTITKLDHSYGDWTEILWPDCTEPGKKERLCLVCGRQQTEDIPATGHTWDKDYIVDKEATCKETGIKKYFCTECGAVRTETIAKTSEHSWDAGKVKRVATTETEGIKLFTCTICKTTREEIIPKKEKPSGNDDGKTIETGTNTEEGKNTGKEASDKIAADKKAANNVITMIQSLSASGAVDKSSVTKARKAYEALTADQKKLVSKAVLEKLTKAEQVIKNASAESGSDGKTEQANAAQVVEKGKTYTVGKLQYQVTNPDSKGNGTVTLKGTTAKKTKLKKLTVPDTVTINGASFKVNAIGAGAFKGFKKMKSVTIGKNVEKIGKSAFQSCKKLKTIKIKTSLLTAQTIGKKAFKGTAKKAKVKVPGAMKKQYKKILRKKGLSKKAKVK